MKMIELASGDQMPMLGLGTWKMSDGSAFEAVKSAIENGYRHIDCAWIYENEQDVGRAIKHCLDSGVVSRQELWITSKLWNDRHRTEHVADALKESLTHLQLDYLDLYLMHWPVAHKFGVVRPEAGDQFETLQDVPLTDTWSALLGCVDDGLVRNAGVSNFNQTKLQFLIDATGKAPAANQVESHPLLPQNELVDFCQQQKIVYTAYSPLGSGDRPDAMKSDSEPNMFDNPVIQTVAKSNQLTAAQVMLAWAVQRGTVPIPKSGNPQRQLENLKAAGVQLSPQELQAINEINQPFRYVDGTFWEYPGGPYTANELWNA